MKKTLLILFLCFNLLAFRNNDLTIDQYKTETIHITLTGDYPLQEIELPVYSEIQNVFELIDTSDYDISMYNIHTVLEDNDVIPLYFYKDTLISINTADLNTLCQLKGIGENIAKRIIEYREINGPFSTIDELMKVKGIGNKKFESIKEFICL